MSRSRKEWHGTNDMVAGKRFGGHEYIKVHMRSNEKGFPLHFKRENFGSLYHESPSKGFAFAITSDVTEQRGDQSFARKEAPKSSGKLY